MNKLDESYRHKAFFDEVNCRVRNTTQFEFQGWGHVKRLNRAGAHLTCTQPTNQPTPLSLHSPPQLTHRHRQTDIKMDDFDFIEAAEPEISEPLIPAPALQRLPVELLAEIVSQCSERDTFCLCLLNRYFYHICTPLLYKNHLKRLQTDFRRPWRRRHEALAYAIYKGATSTLRRLLDAGLDLNNYFHDNSISIAASEREYGIMQFMLENGADPDGAHCSPRQPESHPLAYVAEFQNLEATKMLVEYGADVNLIPHKSHTALVCAIGDKDCDNSVLEYLLEHGADPNRFRRESAIACAVRKNNIEAVRLLIKHGAKLYPDPIPDIGPSSLPPSPLAHFGWEWETIINKSLLAGAYHKHHNLEMTRLLIENGLDVEIEGGECNYTLLAAAEALETDIVKWFFSKGVLPPMPNVWQGTSILHTVAAKGHLPMLKVLVEDGEMDVNVEDFSGRRPIHDAICYPEVVKWFISKGSEVTTYDQFVVETISNGLVLGKVTTEVAKLILGDDLDRLPILWYPSRWGRNRKTAAWSGAGDRIGEGEYFLDQEEPPPVGNGRDLGDYY